MRSNYICILIALLGIAFSPLISSEEFVPRESIATTTDALNKVQEEDHLVYLIIVGLLSAITGLIITLKVLWVREGSLTQRIEELNIEKLEIALESANAVRESIEVVKEVHGAVSKLTQSEMDKRIYDIDIKNLIVNMSTNINSIISVLEKIQQKCDN